jgi:predicted RNA-binding Zn-ribbon protein involved in translation (DUF1610 family)
MPFSKEVMASAQAYVFICPECQEEIRIDAGMRSSLIDSGCVVCGSEVTNEAFTRM